MPGTPEWRLRCYSFCLFLLTFSGYIVDEINMSIFLYICFLCLLCLYILKNLKPPFLLSGIKFKISCFPTVKMESEHLTSLLVQLSGLLPASISDVRCSTSKPSEDVDAPTYNFYKLADGSFLS